MATLVIDLGIARELVRQGFGVILLGHLADELASAAASLRADHPDAKVRTLVLDARTATPDDMAAAPFRTHTTYTPADVDAIINQNARFTARLTALLLPALSSSSSSSRGRSLILTLSSAGYVGIPWLVMYGATKAFNRAFGAGLARELAAHPETAHVDSFVVLPGERADRRPVRGRDVVRKVDAALRNGWREMHPHWRHEIEAVLLRIAPEAARMKG
ncbi:hypothetical protein VTG60DRAFT_4258 [Thermothelomyces hinnuleus]